MLLLISIYIYINAFDVVYDVCSFFFGGGGINDFENIPMNVNTMSGKIPGNQILIFSAFAPSLLPFEERAASFCPHRPAVTVVKDRDAGVGSNPMRPV